jgi:hypothetical protein
MMGSTHIVQGATAGAWTAAFIPGLPHDGNGDLVRIAMVALCANAALWPDIDHHRGRITWALPPLTNVLSWAVRGAPIPFTDRRVWRGVRHREETHWPRTAFIVGVVSLVPLWFLPAPFGTYCWALSAAVTLGWLTHLAGDARTFSGIPLRGGRFWLGKRESRLRVLRLIRTGSDEERAVRRFWSQAAVLSMFAAAALSA